MITSRNNPKVKKVTGNVSKTSIGFTKKFNNPKTIATIIADLKPSTCAMLGKKCVIIITKAAVIRILKISFINYTLRLKK